MGNSTGLPSYESALRIALLLLLLPACASDQKPLILGPPLDTIPGTYRVVGAESLPYFPKSMGKVMNPAPQLLDQLISQFVPIANARDVDPTVFWLAFHFWVADKFNGMAMGDGFDQAITLEQARWLSYATCYWGGVEERKYYAQPIPLFYRTILASMNLFRSRESSVEEMVTGLMAMDAALAGPLADKHAEITYRLRASLPGPYGQIIGRMIFSTAYDTFYLVIVGEAPPKGERPPHLKAFKFDLVVADPKVFMQIDYAEPLADWLVHLRATYESAKNRNPIEFEELLIGSAPGDVAGGPNDLRTLWAEGFDTARANWGGDRLDPWTQAQYDANMQGNVRWNMGLEAISLAALSALLDNDADLADKALGGNSRFVAAWYGFANAFTASGSVDAALPHVVRN